VTDLIVLAVIAGLVALAVLLAWYFGRESDRVDVAQQATENQTKVTDVETSVRAAGDAELDQRLQQWTRPS
jgi:Flp pilus assembly protein CpaB